MAELELDNTHESEQEEFSSDGMDTELEMIKERFKEIEEDANKLHMKNPEKDPSEANTSVMTEEEKAEVDLRSIYVGNVDYGSTAEELESHFGCCGAINRITILVDKFTGHPKGFAYVEFESADAIEAAVALDESNFRGRQLKVLPKRTNIPGLSATNRGFRRPRRRFGGYGTRFGYGFARPRTSRFRRRRVFYGAPY